MLPQHETQGMFRQDLQEKTSPKSKLKVNTKSSHKAKGQGPRTQVGYKNARFSRDPGPRLAQPTCCHQSQGGGYKDIGAPGQQPQLTLSSVQGHSSSQDHFLGQSQDHLKEMVKNIMAEYLSKMGGGHQHHNPSVVPAPFWL